MVRAAQGAQRPLSNHPQGAGAGLPAGLLHRRECAQPVPRALNLIPPTCDLNLVFRGFPLPTQPHVHLGFAPDPVIHPAPSGSSPSLDHFSLIILHLHALCHSCSPNHRPWLIFPTFHSSVLSFKATPSRPVHQLRPQLFTGPSSCWPRLSPVLTAFTPFAALLFQ